MDHFVFKCNNNRKNVFSEMNLFLHLHKVNVLLYVREFIWNKNTYTNTTDAIENCRIKTYIQSHFIHKTNNAMKRFWFYLKSNIKSAFFLAHLKHKKPKRSFVFAWNINAFFLYFSFKWFRILCAVQQTSSKEKVLFKYQ